MADLPLRRGRWQRAYADAVAGELTEEAVAGVEFKKLSKIKNFYHLFHRFTSFAVPLPLCRGRLYACVPNGFISGLARIGKGGGVKLLTKQLPRRPKRPKGAAAHVPEKYFFRGECAYA